MESHRYNLEWTALARLCGWPIAFLGVLALLISAAVKLGALPPPLPVLDVDRTILLHQAAAAVRSTGATTLLIGDSSCLMDVSAPLLEQELGNEERVLNLGAISYLDLDAFGKLIARYLEANPGSVQRIVLLMHPEALRLRQRDDYFANVLDSYWNHSHALDTRTPPLVRWSGGEALQTRVLSRWVPTPLPGPWGQFYGFSKDLWEYLDAHQGSAIDPRSFSALEAKGNPEYRLVGELEKASAAFRSTLPKNVELIVGITPSPKSYVLPSHDQTCAEMLKQWAAWLEADRALTPLPCSLPDELFASTTHLNAAGRLEYTKLLARELKLSGNPTRNDP